MQLFAGCAHLRRAECTAHEGSAWREITSTHFRLKTNVDSNTAREVVLNLERWRKALLVGAWDGALDPPGRLDAILLHSREQLREFGDRDAPAFFTRDTEGPLVVLTGQQHLFDASPHLEQLNHELAHYLSYYSLLRQPRWFAEGLATYLQTARRFDASQVRVGEDHPVALAWTRRNGRVRWEDLWRWRGDEKLSDAERMSRYATS
jgi:hypothetical protein